MSDKFSLEQLEEYQRLMEKVTYIQEHEKDPDLELLTDEESKSLNKFINGGLPAPEGNLLIQKEWPKIYINFSRLLVYGCKEYEQVKEELGKISWRAQFREFLKANGIESPA